MFAHFQEYAESVKPSLDTAFTGVLGDLLEDTGLLGTCGEARLLNGGKKIRGALLCLVVATLGGTMEGALPRAVAVELIQTATLIHDDFVDQHRSRRDEAAIWTLEGARRAVLLGDVIFASAIRMMSELGRDDGLIASRAIAEVSRGACREPLDSSALLEVLTAGRVNAPLYEKIIHLKTGILFGAACQLGAVAAGADEVLQHAWRRYGEKIGEAYQIADDLHDVEHCLRSRFVAADGITSLVPALLFFAGGSRARLLEALRQGSSELEGDLLHCFREAAASMKMEKEKRLWAAVAQIADCTPESSLAPLARQAPADLIRMFDGVHPPVSSP